MSEFKVGGTYICTIAHYHNNDYTHNDYLIIYYNHYSHYKIFYSNKILYRLT